MKELLSLFSTIAQIDSPSGFEEAITQFALQYLRALGLNPVIIEQMVYCRVGQEDNPVLFSAHLDTVEPGRGVKVQEVDGYLCSNGTTILGGDNKIPLAAILDSLRRLIESKYLLNLELLLTVREETDSGIRQLPANLLQSKQALLFDHSEGDLGVVITKAPAISDFVITINGQGAHASLPENGYDALRYFLQLANRLPLARPTTETTFNIGLINGGTATNTVPDRLSISGDLRSTNLQSFADIQARLNQLLVSTKNIAVHIDWQPYSFGYQIDDNDRDLVRLQSLYNKQGISLKQMSTTGGSDADYLNHLGLKAFCLGDGLEFTHTVKERIKVNDFYRLAQIIEYLMLRYGYA